jgi:hypothetical protein
MTSAPSSTLPLARANLHEDETLLPVVPQRPRADIPTIAITQAVAEELNAVDRQYLDHILTSRYGNEGISSSLQGRKPVRVDR